MAHLSLQDGLFHQRTKQLEDLPGWQARAGANTDDRVFFESPCEHRQPRPQHPLAFVEQPVAPADRRLERLLTGLGATVSAAQA